MKRARHGGWASGVRALQGERPPKGSQIGHSFQADPPAQQGGRGRASPYRPPPAKAGPSWRRLLRGRWSLAIFFYRLVAGASAGVTPPRMQGTAPRARKQLWGLATGCGETSPPRRVGLRCKGFARGKAAKGQPDWALFQADALRCPSLNFPFYSTGSCFV